MKPIILFDLDGTLTDPREGITKSVQHALRAYGIEETDLDKLCLFIGPPLMDSFKEFYGLDDREARDAIGVFQEYFAVKGIYENRVYPGIRELLSELRKAGCTLLVATSKPEQFAKQILAHFGLREFFDLVGGADMEEIRVRKGDVILYTLDRLEKLTGKPVCRSRVFMVGDRMHDVMGAKEAGISCVGVLYGYGDRRELTKAGADELAESVPELHRLLNRLASSDDC